MNWVRLTRPDHTNVWLNLDRFDTVTVVEGVTSLIATLSDTEEDNLCVEVIETPEEFLK